MNLKVVIVGGIRIVDLIIKWEFDVLVEKMDEMVCFVKF